MSKPGGSVQLASVRISAAITTGADTELFASLGKDISYVEVYNSTDQDLQIRNGVAASEVEWFMVGVGSRSGKIMAIANEGMRISVRALGGNTTSGTLVMNLWT